MPKKKKEITTEVCDICKQDIKNSDQETFFIIGGDGDGSHTARIKITTSLAYAWGYEASCLCNKCKIKLAEELIRRLKNEG